MIFIMILSNQEVINLSPYLFDEAYIHPEATNSSPQHRYRPFSLSLSLIIYNSEVMIRENQMNQ